MNAISNSAKRVNRADLLRLLQLGDDDLDITAELSGFVAPPRRKVKLEIPLLHIAVDEKSTHQTKSVAKHQKGKQAHFYRITEQKRSELLPEPILGKAFPKPQWFQTAERLNPDTIKPSSEKPPAKEPLVRWSKLWPLLRSLLSEVIQTRQPDIPRIVKTIANGVLLERIPRRTRQRWAATVQVLVERPERTCLFNRDYNQLLVQLKQLRGANGLDIQQIMRQPGEQVRIECGKKSSVRDWQVPVAGTLVFILSDLGLLDKSGIALRAWLHVGQQLRLAGCRPVVLLPLPERYLTPDLVGLFDCVSWDRSSKLQKATYVIPRDEGAETPLQKDSEGAKQLLAWLSPAVRVESALLRAVRHHLPIQQADIGHEVAAWHHDDVVPSPIGFHFQTKALEAYRQQFKYQADRNPELAKTITRLIRDYHCHVFPTQRDEELLILAQLMGDKLDAGDRQELVQARYAMCKLVKASIEQGKEIPALHSFLGNLFERQHTEVLTENEFYQGIWAIRQSELGISAAMAIPDDWDIATVLSFMGPQSTETRDYTLFQEGMRTLQLSASKRFQDKQDGFTTGSPLAEFRTSSGYLLKQQVSLDGKIRNILLPLNDVDSHELMLDEQEKQQLHIAGEALTVERFIKPDWAISIGNDVDGLYVESRDSNANTRRWYWHSPEWRTGEGMLRGFWFYSPTFAATLKPDWVVAADRDQFGLYADVEIFKIPQRFRWIEPTSFLMGSPENEAGRYGDETQHTVILTQGYWLADTACTQALWEAVMRSNPSEFKGGMRPVENVSWNEIQNFLEQLNKQHSELNLRLPTEAEWENACRVGTTGAFNFDGELSLDKVNYRGTWKYESDKWGEGALKETADVKSYPPNAWGLYQMHGNVWEWCQDRFGDYPAEPVIDPQGLESGDSRVLRGGSWFYYGRLCRSAARIRDVPSYRGFSTGFRLARGHELR